MAKSPRPHAGPSSRRTTTSSSRTSSKSTFAAQKQPPAGARPPKRALAPINSTAAWNDSVAREQGRQAGAKGKRLAREEDDEEVPKQPSAKALGKRRKGDGEREREPSVEGGQEGDQPKKKTKPKGGPVRAFTRVVSRGAIRKWKKLSHSGGSVVKASLEDAAIELLATLDSKHRGDVQSALRELFEEVDDVLSDLLVPPTAGRKATKGEADILTSDEINDRTALMEAALEPELAEVRTLRLAVEREKKALVADEARLENFETKRQKVEDFETKEASKNLHPLVSGLFGSKSRARPSLALFDRATPSNAWICEGAATAFAKGGDQTVAEEDSDEDQDEDEGPYDPSKDDYMVQLSARLTGCVGEIEKRLGSLRRAERIVDQAERSVVGLF